MQWGIKTVKTMIKNKNSDGVSYGRQTQSKYKIKKERARDEAVEFLISAAANNYSYSELLEKQNYFGKLAKRYGLKKEFKENGII